LVCPKCGSQLPEKAKFCLECGSTVSSESGAEAPDVSLGGLKTLDGADGESDQSSVDASLGGMRTMTEGGTGRDASPDSGIALSDRYEVARELGRGGFAVVHLGRDLRLDRPVAIKRLLPEAAAGPHGARTVARFEREAQAIASLNHRNVVAVYDTDRDADGRYIVMEYVEGGTLRDHMKESGPLPVSEAVTLVVGICRGLASAHRKGVVHRDVKPANILLAREEGRLVPKLTDFGLARAGGGSDVSMTGFGMGTPFYMAPEQRRDAKGVNHTADIYSVGKTLYELVTGQVPENVDPGEIPPPPELAGIIFRCIKTKPEERYFSVEDLARDLEALPDPDAPVPARQSSTGGENPCPQCGAENPVSSLFCVGCGSGMSRDCPECGAKNSVNLTFCGQCGTDVEAFATIAEALRRMAEHIGKRRWSRVLKELAALPESPRLPGEKGVKLLADVQSFGEQAKDAREKLADLDRRIESAIADQDFDAAIGRLQEYAALAPEEDSRAELHSQLNDARCLVGLRHLRDRMRELQETKEYDKALGAGPKATELLEELSVADEPSPLRKEPDGSPNGETGMSLKAEIDVALDAIREIRTEADELLAGARDAAGEGRFDAALGMVDRTDGMYPGRPGSADLRQRLNEAAEEERADTEALRNAIGTLREALAAGRLSQARQEVDRAKPAMDGRSIHSEQAIHEEWSQLHDAFEELSTELAEREKRVEELLAAAERDIGAGRFEHALGASREAQKVFVGDPRSLLLLERAGESTEREKEDLQRLKVLLKNARAALELSKLNKAREMLDEEEELASPRTIAESESVYAEWQELRERLAELAVDLETRQAEADELVATCRERLAAGALREAGAMLAEIDSVEAERVGREGLAEDLLVARRARLRRRSLWAVASLTVLVVLAVLAMREVRYRVARGSFERAVVEGRLDEARALAAAKPLHGRSGDAQRLLAVFADARNAGDEALRAEAPADAPDLWQNAESLLESPAAHDSEGSSRDYASHRDALLSGWKQATDRYTQAKAYAEGVQSLRKARARYKILWTERPWKDDVLSAEAKTTDRAKLTALLDQHAGAQWLETKQALASADVLERGEDWTQATAKTAAASTSLPEAVKTADRSFRKSACDKALAAGKAAKMAGNWEAVVSAVNKALVLDAGNGDALALKREAEDHLAPSLRVVCVLDGREVTGAAITVNDTVQQATTPTTLELVEGKMYAIKITLSLRGKTRYTTFAKALAADWKGERELRAEVEDMTEPTAGNVLGMAFVEVPAGTFRMGSTDGDGDEKPMHEVRITRPFWLGKCEVMQTEYEKLMGRNPSRFKGARNPVEQVSWNDAVAFCSKLTERERAAGRLRDGYVYRLPTEAEWEYAARGGTQSKGFTYSGSNDAGEVAWYGGNSGGNPHPVGREKPNELGLHDMSGNVWEWCQDWHGDYPSGAAVDPAGPRTGSTRVYRGGSWGSSARNCRAAFRGRYSPAISSFNLGFRVALAAPVQ
jgi:formylglycine-generating enzyme required for sulfatase activity/ribosomal protein L40E